MQLVVLAAGHGTRYGGVKQLAPVGPHDEAIMDYTAIAAESCGFDGVVSSCETRSSPRWSATCRHLPGTSVSRSLQGPPRNRPGRAVGPAGIDGAFGVANADDLYGERCLQVVRRPLRPATPRPTGRAKPRPCRLPARTHRAHGPDGHEGPDHRRRGRRPRSHRGELRRAQSDGTFVATRIGHLAEIEPRAPRVLDGTESVSMNLWGFHPRIFDELHLALGESDACNSGRTVLLPEVIGDLVTSGADKVHVVATTSRCIGITNPDDFELVHDELSVLPSFSSRLGASQRA